MCLRNWDCDQIMIFVESYFSIVRFFEDVKKIIILIDLNDFFWGGGEGSGVQELLDANNFKGFIIYKSICKYDLIFFFELYLSHLCVIMVIQRYNHDNHDNPTYI